MTRWQAAASSSSLSKLIGLQYRLRRIPTFQTTPKRHPLEKNQVHKDYNLPDTVKDLRVLLAEDNFINQRVGLRQLQKLGCYVHVVENGLEALKILESEPFDVIFMDLSMPELDGIQATRAIIERYENPPYIIALTANAMEQNRIACMEAGMQDFLPKPITLAHVSRALLKYFDRKENRSRSAVN